MRAAWLLDEEGSCLGKKRVENTSRAPPFLLSVFSVENSSVPRLGRAAADLSQAKPSPAASR